MGMLVHNGRLIAGSLPLAEVYDYLGDNAWTKMTQLDATPDVRYRRAWTMAEFGGRLFCSTLPSGRVFSYQAGRMAMWDKEFPAGGWHHVAAVKSAEKLSLYVDGRQVAESTTFTPAEYDLSSSSPLHIGFGPDDYFCGSMADVRLYGAALAGEDIKKLAIEAP
jgi:Concanavalin A-like lectin/glucanases superfamily